MLIVTLVHYEAPDWIRSAADTIVGSEPPVHLLVVSNSGPVDIPGAEVIVTPSNNGFAAAANVGIRRWLAAQDSPPYAVVASHDLHVEPDTFRLLVDFMEREPRVGVCAPSMPDAARGPSRGDADYDWLSGQCLMFRRECVEAIGSFDERFGSYVEDVDIGLRAWDGGWRVSVVEDAHAHGLGSAISSRGALRRMRWANQVGLARKRRGALGGARVLAAQLILAARSLGRAAFDRGRATSHLAEARDRLLSMPAEIQQFRRFGRP